ncbi:hypothetical protein ACIKT0_19545, partial [Hansschlegelia beijingensis]
MSEAKRVLIIGEKPDMVDFSDPAIPPGMDAAKVQAGLDAAMRALRERRRRHREHAADPAR